MKDVLVSVKIYWTKIVTFCCNLTSISIIRKCVCYCSCNGVQKCQTVEVTHHNNKQLREKKPLTIQEVLVIEQVVKWSFDFEVHTQQYWWCALHSAVHTRLHLGLLDRSFKNPLLLRKLVGTNRIFRRHLVCMYCCYVFESSSPTTTNTYSTTYSYSHTYNSNMEFEH